MISNLGPRLARLRVGLLLSSSCIVWTACGGRPPADFDGEWLWVSSFGGYFNPQTWYPDPGHVMVLTLTRGRYHIETNQQTDLFPPRAFAQLETEFEGQYALLDSVITSTYGHVGRPMRMSSPASDYQELTWIPEVRGDTLVLHCYMDDGSDYIFVRRD